MIIDLAAPLFDEAVIPSPLESSKAGKNNQEASSTAERDLKKDKDDKKDDKDKGDDKEIKNGVTIIEPKSHSIIGTGNTVYHVSAGVIDLTNAPITIPPSTPASCFEIKPYMGCDRGGADNQRLEFFGHDFGMGCQQAAQTNPCLFALMPIRMAYYCPKQGRPVCGGKCYSVAQHCPADGTIVDMDGIGHNVTDTKWRDANADSWNYWPANFGEFVVFLPLDHVFLTIVFRLLSSKKLSMTTRCVSQLVLFVSRPLHWCPPLPPSLFAQVVRHVWRRFFRYRAIQRSATS